MKYVTIAAAAIALAGLVSAGSAQAQQQFPQERLQPAPQTGEKVEKPYLTDMWREVLWRKDTTASLSQVMADKEELHAEPEGDSEASDTGIEQY